jgi:RHS repeat-associated protein
MPREGGEKKLERGDDDKFRVSAPQISLPKGGGAISGIGEKFAANPVTGTGSMSLPIATSPGRSGFGPQLSLSYDSGAGNGLFGFGWNLSIPSITRRTDRGLPKYFDAEESDTFILSGAEDLVPVLVNNNNGKWERQSFDSPASEPGYTVQRYRPRIEGLFARIERWTEKETGISHWRSISRDNITSLYGKRDDARITDPADQTRVFEWFICESYDDKGNAIFYRYKPEDDANIDPTAPYERNRLITKRFTERYVKNICYGNRSPRMVGEDLLLRHDWLFEVVFDYGEHDEAAPTTAEARTWPARQDPFSRFRSTFEIRTYRLCRRVLMFHHFPEELGGTADYLVRSTDLEYKGGSVASFISSATRAGYVQQPDRSYLRKALPQVEFKYTEVQIDETVHEIDSESLKNLPYGVDGTRYEWVDLDSEGLTGVLTEQADAWYYKRNLGNGTFGPAESVVPKPSLAALSRGQQQLVDLAGEGHLDLVQFDGPMAGFHERTAEGGWGRYTRFKSVPNIDTKDPNLRFVDLTGDGHPDILLSEDTVFTWYESLAKNGFGPAGRSPKSWDEETGPQLVFSDPTQSVFLADMSGDGLSDLVRIRYAEVCYWPNLGYGRFGAKVAMGNVPVFERPEIFDPKRIHLADIDGSGNTDIIYIGHDGISLYFNQSGNFWSAPQRLAHYPRLDSLKSVAVTDLLGNGTACLVWSSPLASDVRQPMRYIDLMGGQKPHLLVYTTNNMGAETEVQYTASTKFYLQDRLEGRPWVTKLPFPVHVIERVESRDLVSNTKLISTYRYRHGYFDGVEREFRGFAHVEQRDAESVVSQFDLPPVVMKTWFHTGAFLEGSKLEAYFKDPVNQEYFTGDTQAAFLPDTELPPDLSADEMRGAARALKGGILRQEVYADDGPAKVELPYTVSERSYRLTCLQPQGPNRHAVFFSHPGETLEHHYERNPADPRISHALTLEVDDYGNVLKSVAIGYQRRVPLSDEQQQILGTLIEAQYTNDVLEDDAYRTPLPAEVKTYELTAPMLKGARPLDFAAVEAIAATANEIVYEAQPIAGQTQKRLIEQLRTLYRKNDLSALLPAGKVESMALPGESCKLALTAGLLDIFQAKASRGELSNILTGPEAGYRDLDGAGRFWIPSGQAFYSPNPGDSAQQELPFARAHFFLPHRFQDPFGNNTVVAYNGKYNLLLVSARDAIGNETDAEHDYRVLQPKMVTDPNGNRTQARFDALGMLAGTAVQGKAAGPVEGDSFGDFAADLTPAQITEFFDTTNPRALAATYLGTATTRIVYDLERVPPCAASIARETHVSALAQGRNTKVQLHFVYSDGFGRVAQTKVQAEPGPLDLSDPTSPVTNPRWVGTGGKVYNNKGKPIRQYEPFFSPTPQFGIENWGVSSTLFYDPVGRVVVTLHPNHTWEKVVFDPWQQTSFDVNDTVTFDPKTDPDAGAFFRRLPEADYLPTWYQMRLGGALGPREQDAARKAAIHAATPSVAHADSLGRTFLTVAHNTFKYSDTPPADPPVEEFYRTRVIYDIEGNERGVIDALERVVMRYDYDMLGTKMHQASMEAGERWMLNDVAGQPLYGWDSRDHRSRIVYDGLRRPKESYLREGAGTELLVGRTVYGETRPNPETNNLRGKVVQLFDQAGVVTSDDYDFKGNLLASQRQLAKEYKATLDWSGAVPLEDAISASRTSYDALNRPTELFAQDDSTIRPGYNEASLLEQVDVNLRGAPSSTPFVTNIDYDAKGQRTLIDYGNGVSTTYDYDPLTLRLVHLLTKRNAAAFPGDCPQPPPAGWPGCQVQNLSYTYDPAGNITHIRDDAQQINYFRNKRVEPSAEYTYDAVYRLIEAKGREHLGQVGGAPSPGSYNDAPRVGVLHPSDGAAMGLYLQRYLYDAMGNFEAMIHRGMDPANPGWTRAYAYEEPSLIESGKKSNRLTSTTIGAATETYSAGGGGYDAHGNMLRLPQLQIMQWDFRDQLHMTQRQAVNAGDEDGARHRGERTYYVYDGAGQRARKVTERQAAAGQTPARMKERIYLGGFEIYREYGADGSTVALERETLHVMDDKQRIALVETRTQGIDESLPQLIRYQSGNHLSSASLELGGAGQIISYEEYYPYGSTSYQARPNAVAASAKRYRYAGMERDEETGLAYHGARYYAGWLGRWTAVDPSSIATGLNLYVYAANNPSNLIDTDGKEPKKKNTLFGNAPAGSAYDKAWRRHFETRSDTGLVLKQSTWKDADTMKGKLVLGRRRRPDLGVEWKATPGQGIAVEIGSPPSFLSLKKIRQLAQDASAIERGLVLGNKETGPLRINESFSARGLPIVGDGGNVPGSAPVQFYEPGERPLPPEPVVSPKEPLGGRGLVTTTVAVAATALVVFGPGSAKEKALTLAVGYGMGKGTEFLATRAVGAELAGILSAPIALVIGMCSDQGSACEDQARAKAHQELLDKINGRAWAIYYSELGTYPGPEWNFAYDKAVHEKYVELGLDKADEARQKLLRAQPLLNNTAPIVNDTAPRMNAR